MVRDVICDCDGCENIHLLSIKAVLHCGEVLVWKVRKFKELSGTSVMTAHRLMKNHVPVKEYILVAEEFDRAWGGMPGQEGTPLVEECEGIGKVNVAYYVPDFDLLAPPAATNRLRQARTMAVMMLFLLRRKLGLLPKREFHSLANLGPVAAKSA